MHCRSRFLLKAACLHSSPPPFPSPFHDGPVGSSTGWRRRWCLWRGAGVGLALHPRRRLLEWSNRELLSTLGAGIVQPLRDRALVPLAAPPWPGDLDCGCPPRDIAF